jgi:DNA polymerase-3 subunit delta'
LLAQRIATDRLAHSILFTGPPGTGKTTLALALARTLNCTDPAPPCSVCRACRLTLQQVHPDLQIIQAEPGERLKIDRIRDLQRGLALAPFEARYRIAIIRNMQQATPNAADALLKTLEEPPLAVRMLLTADMAEAVPPTIVSRCQVVALRLVSAARIEQALVDRWQAEPERARVIARLAGGRVGWALRALEQPETLADRDRDLDDLQNLLGAGRVARFAYAEALSRERDRIPNLVETWQAWWRDVLLVAEGSSAPLTNEDRHAILEAQAAQVGASSARQALEAVRRVADQLSKNANVRLALEVLLLDLPNL